MKPFIGGVVFEKQDEIKNELDKMLERISQDIAKAVN
jgi:hypothetical protein